MAILFLNTPLLRRHLFILSFILVTGIIQGQPANGKEAFLQEYRALLDSAEVLSVSDSVAEIIVSEFKARLEIEPDPILKIQGLSQLSSFYSTRENFSTSLVYLRKSHSVAKTHSFHKESAEALRSIGTIYQNQSLYDSSMIYFTKSLQLFEDIHDSVGVYQTLSSLGNLHLEMLQLEEALSYINKVTPIVEALNDSVGLCGNIHQKGTLYQKLKMFDEALANYKTALELALKLGRDLQAAVLYGNIGSTLVEMDNEEGLAYLQTALKMKTEFGASTKSVLHTLMDLALGELQFNRPANAAEYSYDVIEKSQALNDGYSLKYGYYFLSRSYRDLGNYKKAYDFQRQYYQVKDSLFNLEKSRQIKELEISYETEKKDQAIHALGLEKEIEATRKQIFLFISIAILIIGSLLVNWQRIKTKKNRQLLEREKELDRLKSNFFANISHEFRTPLTLIIGPIETMLSKTRDQQDRQQLDLIKRNAQRLLRLINDILDLTRFEAGHLRLHASRCDIIGIIKGVAMTFSSLAEIHHIKYDIEIDVWRENLEPYFDQGKIETILINLLSNAFKFTPDKGRVTLRVTQLGSGPGSLKIEVMDTGSGIPKEKLNRIFDRFYQVEDGATRKYQGTGIGLAFTKQLVEMHSGTISVKSSANSGTIVEVVLPLGKNHLEPDQIVMEGNQTERITEQAKGNYIHPIPENEGDVENKPIVLIIEDNEDVREYIHSILSSEYMVRQAVDGAAGIETAFELIPDLIISDVMMPKKDGFEVSRTLKQNPRTSHIPLILLTAKNSVTSRLTGLETEADVYLNKPFLPRELLLQIRNLIHSRKLLREKYKSREGLRPSEIAINSVDEKFLERLLKVMEKHYSDPEFTVERLCAEVGMSRSQLHRKLQALTNESTSQFIRTFRLQKAMMLIKAKSGNISEIAYQVGFNNVSYFNKCFLELYNCRPGEAS